MRVDFSAKGALATNNSLVCVTYIHDGGERCCGYVRADGGEDSSADLPDVSARLGQQGQQDVHHHLHPLGLLILLLLLCGCTNEKHKYSKVIKS